VDLRGFDPLSPCLQIQHIGLPRRGDQTHFGWGRGDAEAPEDHVRGHIHIRAVGAKGFGKFPLLLAAAALERHVAMLAIAAVFDGLDRLQEATIRDRLQTSLGKFRGDPLDGDVVAGLQGHAALQGVRSQKRKIRA
jgi:hypothetical protein